MKAHPKFTNYICDDHGNVFSLYTGRKLTTAPNPDAYINLGLYLEGSQIYRYKHVIVWEAFNERMVPAGYEIDHIDGNKLNNCIKNLACLTRKEHRLKTYRENPHMTENFIKSQWRKVMRVSATGQSTEFASLKAAALSVMGSASAISEAILNGDNYYCGYFWSYVENCDFDGEYWTDVVDTKRNGIVVLKVSNFGRLQNSRNRKTFGHRTPVRYGFCYLGKRYAVHELICQVFWGPKPTSAHTVDHLNRDPHDNRPDNLRWATRRQQARNTRSVRPVEGYVLDTGLSLGIWPTIADASVATGAHICGISMVLKKIRKSSGKTSDGKKIAWRYDEILFI